nr:MAG TPA: hypothetical protein [Bacteriophage sp.]DAV23932.1 MAG TPA: hypothetical protein [Bacteriophage sp.]
MIISTSALISFSLAVARVTSALRLSLIALSSFSRFTASACMSEERAFSLACARLVSAVRSLRSSVSAFILSCFSASIFSLRALSPWILLAVSSSAFSWNTSKL